MKEPWDLHEINTLIIALFIRFFYFCHRDWQKCLRPIFVENIVRSVMLHSCS